MGGENDQDNILTIPYQGSSPHGRGKPTRWRGRLTSPGLIPAWAGKTDRRSRPAWAARTHPRMGGENGAASSCQAPRHGSSPHGRGKPVSEWAAKRRWRLIPARAGKTPEWIGRLVGRAAHPRAGGENPPALIATWWAGGSSPRGRGKRLASSVRASWARLIPARAGKTRMRTLSISPSRAHPRAGGENRPSRLRPWSANGSSPRGRGKQRREGGGRPPAGLIPARAGKTLRINCMSSSLWAHPRAGGENSSVRGPEGAAAGSSPRGRGKLGLGPAHAGRIRLIPARAGKTRADHGRCYRARAHPRAGGENTRADTRSPCAAGSSPRGRGKHRCFFGGGLTIGLIPARAGKTP